MKIRIPHSIACLAGLLLCLAAAAQTPPTIDFNSDPLQPAFSLRGWEAGAGKAETSQPDSFKPFFSVFVDQDADTQIPPLSGTYRWTNGGLIFTPRYPLQPGLRYRAEFRPAGADTAASQVISKSFAIPKGDTTPTSVVEQVYPTTGRLPENQLKLYVRFSAPMSRGEAYEHAQLLDADGNVIELPFLEIDQELWDPEGKRLTLLFDPGRVKRDLLPNREAGSPLEAGSSYTLVIGRDWLDAERKPLKQEFRKPFNVGPADHEPPSEQTWQVGIPRSGSREPLTLLFPEPMDYAMLLHSIDVLTPAGGRISGAIEIGEKETRWSFFPSEAWKAGDYLIEAATLLEDLAGNSLNRAFEVDVFDKVEDRVERVTRELRFTIAAGSE